MRDIDQIEREVLRLLLAGDSSVLIQLRQQLDHVVKRDVNMTGAGFVTRYELDGKAAPLGSAPTFRIGDVNGKAIEAPDGLGFVLFVKRGLIDNLEGYVFDGAWPDKICNLNLVYNSNPRCLVLPK